MEHTMLEKELLLGEDIVGMLTFGGYPARPGLLLPVRPNVTELLGRGFGLGSQGCCAVELPCCSLAHSVLCAWTDEHMRT